MRLVLPLLLALAACGPKKKPRLAAAAQPAPIDTHLIEVLAVDEPMELVTTETEAGRELLATPSRPVDLKDPALGLLVTTMKATLAEAKGVGIAAPQVGVLSRVILVQRQDLEDEPIQPYYNPVLVWSSADQVAGWEGCLSIPDKRGQVLRSTAIRVGHDVAMGKKVQHVEEEVAHWTARIFQHELDHLDGVLFTQKLITTQTLTAMEFATVRDLWDALEEEEEPLRQQAVEPFIRKEHAEPPFSASDIRDATSGGRRYTWRTIFHGETTFRSVVLLDVDDRGFVMRSALAIDEEIHLTEEPITWETFAAQAYFPIDGTEISAAWVDLPAGAFDAMVYEVEHPIGTVKTYWFARDLPGSPVRLEHREHGELIRTMELVDHRPGGQE